MNNERALSTMRVEEASMEIDKIVDKCAPLAIESTGTFTESLALAEGIKSLRDIFLHHPGIKVAVESMQDTKLGFLTDRSPKAIAQASKGNKTLSPYPYFVIAECCIEAMMKGYRITNNEFNVIAGGFYAAKNGKYRKIVDNPNISNFQFTTTSPAYEPDNKHAKVKCFASWNQGGALVTLGNSGTDKGKEDTLIFRIRVNAYMGEDAVVGKAISKLFSRVLMRAEGNIIPESTDVDFEQLTEPIEGEILDEINPADLAEFDRKVKESFEKGWAVEFDGSIMVVVFTFLEKCGGVNDTAPDQVKVEAIKDWDNFWPHLRDYLKENIPGLGEKKPDPGADKSHNQEDFENDLISDFVNLTSKGLPGYEEKWRDDIGAWPRRVQERFVEKWKKIMAQDYIPGKGPAEDEPAEVADTIDCPEKPGQPTAKGYCDIACTLENKCVNYLEAWGN